MLRVRILNEFPNIIIEKAVGIDEFNNTNKSDVDFIISTVPLSIKDSEYVLYVTPFLNSNDVYNIRKFINSLDINKKDAFKFVVEDLMYIISKNCTIKNYNRLQKDIKKYFSEEEEREIKKYSLSDFAIKEHTMLQVHYESEEEIILKLGELMYKTGHVTKDYGKAMFETSKKLSKGIIVAKGVALPHARSNGMVKKTAMAFMTLKTPVYFCNNTEEVRFVIALAATNENDHLNALSELLDLLEDEISMNKIMSLNDYDEFMEILRGFGKKYI